MTNTPRITRTLLALALVVAALAALFALLAPDARAAAGKQAHGISHSLSAKPQAPRGAGTGVSETLALIEAASPGGDRLTPAQLTEVFLAADRVCEGFAVKVPVVEMEDTLMAQQGLTRPQAQAFMDAAAFRC